MALNKPDFVNAYFARGELKIKQGDFNAALLDYDRIIQIDVNNKNAYYKKSICYRTLGNADYGLREINRSIKIDSAFPDAYFQRALIYLMLSSFKNAKTDVITALKLGLEESKAQAEQLLTSLAKY